jgi:putative restriction endonuclease
MPSSPRVKWTQEHRLIALNLYCKLPFGKFSRGNPIIKAVAARMRRTADSLAMKLSNFASLDPVQQARGIRGLVGASKEDGKAWNEFHSNLSTLGPQSEQLLHDLFTDNPDQEIDLQHGKLRLEPSGMIALPSGPTELKSLVKVRRGQQFFRQFFRQSVLNAYGVRCCISGINVPRLLVASHIKPWSDFPDERLDLRNGLCLSTVHDAAFDGGLITLDEKLIVVLSKELRTYLPQPALEHNFLSFEGKQIRLPEKLAKPSPAFLTYHREVIFKG